MSRSLSSTIIAHVTGATVRPVFFAQFLFDSGTLNFWTGYGTISHDVTGGGAENWIGAGELWGLSPIIETDAVRATGLEMSLSGLDASIIAVALSEDYQDRTVAVYIGFMDVDGTILDTKEIFKGRSDIMSIHEKGDTTTITLTAESVLISLEKSAERRYTAEDQKKDFAGDLGYDFVPQLQQKELVWGRA